MAANDSEIQEMRENHAFGLEQEGDARKEYEKNLEFIVGRQWKESVRKKREATNRPCLTINLLPEKIQAVTNQVKMNKFSGIVSPVENADEETAEIIQGIGRHIEYFSNEQLAQNTGFEAAAMGGFGYWRYKTQWSDEEGLNQDLIAEPIFDSLSVVPDPEGKRPTGSDCKWFFIDSQMRKEAFKLNYKNSETVKTEFNNDFISDASEWFQGDYVRVSEYWHDKQEKVKRLAILGPEGQPMIVDEDKRPEGTEVIKDDNGEGRERTVTKHNITCKIFNGAEILEQYRWAGSIIPIVRVTGKIITIKGKRYYISPIHHARDPQLLLNYAESAAAEATMLSSKVPWIGAKGSFKDPKWKDAHLKNYAFLEYDPVMMENGQIAPPPARNSFEPAIQAYSMLAVRGGEYIKSTTGLYNPSTGNTREEQRSGKAIRLLQQAGNLANYHLINNLGQSILHGWRIKIDMIPRVYDTERQVRILGNDMKQKIVRVNQQFEQDGKKKIYDLGAGKYDVRVEVGPAYDTNKEENAANMNAFAQAAPELLPRYADLYVKAMNFELADEIADRVMPPEFAGLDKDNPLPPQIQLKMQQMAQAIELLKEELNKSAAALEQKKHELETKREIAFENNETKLTIEALKLEHDQSNQMLQQQIADLQRKIEEINAGRQEENQPQRQQ